MLLKTCIGILCIAATLGANQKPMEIAMNDSVDRGDALLLASERYINFINRISHGEVFPQIEEAATIFATDCKKIFNAHLHTENRNDFVTDLLAVYATYGSWTLIPAEVIRAPESNTVVLRIFIESALIGTNTAIVILRYDSNYLITEINEVFSPVKGSYNFEEK